MNTIRDTAYKIAEELKQQYEIGEAQVFCEEVDWNVTDTDELAGVIRKHLEVKAKYELDQVILTEGFGEVQIRAIYKSEQNTKIVYEISVIDDPDSDSFLLFEDEIF